MQKRRALKRAAAGLALAALAAAASGQGSVVVDLPDPANLLLNTSFVIREDVVYVPSYDDQHVTNKLWSFSLVSGLLLDPDGLLLPAPALATDPALFSGERLGMPGWFPDQAIQLVDISDPADLRSLGTISIGAGANIQGQDIVVDDDGIVGYVASFADDTLYSFNVDSLALEDPDGLILPGNPDRIALAGDRIAIASETPTSTEIVVADVSDPANLTLAGAIPLPGQPVLHSGSTIGFASDGRTGFITAYEGVLYSFDVISLSLLDPDGIRFPGYSGGGGGVHVHRDTVAFTAGTNGLHFVDASDPANLTLIAHAKFGVDWTVRGGFASGFTADGTGFSWLTVWPIDAVYAFEVATGDRIGEPFPVDDYPSFLTVYGPDDRVGVICGGADTIHLIHGLFGPAAPASYCEAKANSLGCTPAITWSGTPSASQPGPLDVGAVQVLNNRNGMVFYGFAPAALPFQGGALCVAPPLRRTPVQNSGGNPPPEDCSGVYSFDFNAWIQSGADPLLAPGVVAWAQYWSRDPSAASGTGLTDALQIPIGP